MSEMKYQVWLDNEITGPEKVGEYDSEKEAVDCGQNIKGWDVYIRTQDGHGV